MQSHEIGRKMTSTLCTFEMAKSFYLQYGTKDILKPRSFMVSNYVECSIIAFNYENNFQGERVLVVYECKVFSI